MTLLTTGFLCRGKTKEGPAVISCRPFSLEVNTV
jgi:hypothetical protein